MVVYDCSGTLGATSAADDVTVVLDAPNFISPIFWFHFLNIRQLTDNPPAWPSEEMVARLTVPTYEPLWYLFQ